MTTIHRLEGSTHDPDLTEGLTARVADPLWYLARQWQVGEFQGEDAATPVVVSAEIDSHSITEAKTATDKTARAIDLRHEPLQTQMEKEPLTLTLSARDSLQAGRRLQDLALGRKAEKLLEMLREKYKLVVKGDGLAKAQLRLLSRGGVDAARLMRDVIRAETVENLDIVAKLGGGRDTIEILEIWLSQETAFAALQDPAREQTWSDKSLDYRLRLSTAGGENDKITLKAHEYLGGRLDWHHFDIERRPKVMRRENTQNLRVLASPLRFAGQPAARFWEMEDSAVYLADMAGGAADLARSVLGAYAAVAGDDWFHLTADIPNGHVAHVVKMSVLDAFGDETTIRSVAQMGGKDRVWRWFEHRVPEGTDPELEPLLFVPPSLAQSHISPALEEVHFRRDEMANLAWAIEKRHRDPLGRGIETPKPPRPAAYEAKNAEDWTFAVSSAVPDHWFPLVPVQIGRQNPQIALRRGQILHDPDREKPPTAQTTILTPQKPFIIDEAEVPFSGARVVRGWRMARSMDGGRHLWIGRKKSPSTGQVGQSPWQVDQLEGWPKAQR